MNLEKFRVCWRFLELTNFRSFMEKPEKPKKVKSGMVEVEDGRNNLIIWKNFHKKSISQSVHSRDSSFKLLKLSWDYYRLRGKLLLRLLILLSSILFTEKWFKVGRIRKILNVFNIISHSLFMDFVRTTSKKENRIFLSDVRFRAMYAHAQRNILYVIDYSIDTDNE